MSLVGGARLGPYEVLCLIGAGGMGEVYKARDTRLDRLVALKTITSGGDMTPDARQRFAREARAIAALSHPHICTLHDVGSDRDIDFIVMEYLDGETLAERIRRGQLATPETVKLAVEIADALAAAHRAGLVHGDVKPANVILGAPGAKLLDFGLARAFRPVSADASVTATATALRTFAGTPAYMAPELWRGAAPSARSDVWALGAVIAEMLSGQGETRNVPPGAPVSLSRIVSQALQDDPHERYASATELVAALNACQRELDVAAGPSLARQLVERMRRPRVAAAVALLIIALGTVTAVGLYRRNKSQAEIRSARQRIPELMELVRAAKEGQAFRLASEIEKVIPDDPTLATAWRAISVTGTLDSRPAGALVAIKPYQDVTGAWIVLGTTPLMNLRVPAGRLRVRAEKDGYEPVLVARTGLTLVKTTEPGQPPLTPARTPDVAIGVPQGLDLQVRDPSSSRMVFIPGKTDYTPVMFYGFPEIPPFNVRPCWFDEYEVTNREYKAFVDAGGYSRPEFWRQPFILEGRTLSRAEATRRFVDATGRPGPAGWQLGDYPDGQADLPVSGVSWFEADAYAKWAGKTLPSVHDWIRAGTTNWAADMLPLSNVATGARRPKGPVPVGTLPGISVWGAFDMAGNVKEWTANMSMAGNRIVLGGAWDEADYMFYARDERDPFDRAADVGFRCARYPDGPPLEAMTWRPSLQRSYEKVNPVSDRTFATYRELYAYDRVPLQSRVEETDQHDQDGWRRETVTYTGAGGLERLRAYVFVPNRAVPPYEAIVYFPGSATTIVGASLDSIPGPDVSFLAKSGRLVIFPVYKGTFDRATPETFHTIQPSTAVAFRDMQIDLAREVSRAVDYLQSRSDVDGERIGYYGLSWGSAISPISLSLDPRFRAAVLVSGGLFWAPVRPDADPANFLPRVRIPVLMINGQYDWFYLPQSRRLFLQLLGSSEKRYKEIPGAGHAGPRAAVMADTLAWLDQHIGPVQSR